MITPPPPKPRSLFEKFVILFATGMGIGFGTCGLVVLTHAGEGRFWSNLATIGTGLFFTSLAGLVLTGVAFIVQQLWELFRK